MAEESEDQDRSEEPSERKIQKSREEGQIPRSRELVTAALISATLLSFWLSGTLVSEQLQGVMATSFTFDKEVLRQEDWLKDHLIQSLSNGFTGLYPFFILIILATIGASLLLGGWLFSNKLLQFKGERISPIKGIQRMFSVRSLMEAIKSIAKVILLGFCLWLSAQWFFEELLTLNRMPLGSALILGIGYLFKAIGVMTLALVIICLIDVPFQRWSHLKKLRMTHKEVRDEMKESEGQPEVRSRLREKQQEISGRRMMQAVPGADVIITNPTHYAVAVRYDQDRARAPYLVAKGVDQVALRICAVAREYNRPVVQSPVLARVVYHTTDLNQEISDELYVAVAQVLAYIKHLNDYQAGLITTSPDMPAPEVPRAFQDKWDKQ
ncbi:flagellar biosynthesis protein FlhB [Endozoicomonas ascidiicola]|uniref:flagellar biosynthesis protein FlhB n=1 Tax=Endozoicomonas ascidiicola TaxID=1698521 RepID=UPI000833B73E|nr:flagellar biosynthesis protein FlhB [Endozoicomonas ascidiicola]